VIGYTFIQASLLPQGSSATVYTGPVMRALGLILGVSLACAGCSARQPVEKPAPAFVKIQTPFDYSEHQGYAKPGTNGINGKAVLTQKGGGVVTCAGNRVLLMPATSYFREMFWHMIVTGSEPTPPRKTHPDLKNMIRRTQCDGQGSFTFSEIPDGTWFLLTQVNAAHGSMWIGEMTLENGEILEALLTDKHIVSR
jgi:hypothetical protein